MAELKQRKRIRFEGWDYSSVGYYFITICTKNKDNIFGSIVGEGLVSSRSSVSNFIELSDLGKIIKTNWENIPEIYQNIVLDQFVIMPNHLHSIVIVNRCSQSSADTRPAPTISEIICSFKSRCTLDFVKLNKENKTSFNYKIWQRSFHDHIIRNEKTLHAIREYILANPFNWQQDVENILKV